MKRLLEQLNSIEAIANTVAPGQIEKEPDAVGSSYELYAATYHPIERVKAIKDRLIAEICALKPVNGYLSADYGYGKTASLIYLWQECQHQGIVAVPPFKFKEIGDLTIATYAWVKLILEREKPELVSEFESIYREYGLKSNQELAAKIASEYKLSEKKALSIVRELNTDTANTDSVLNFWQETVSLLRKANKKGLAIFADECQEFLRTEEGSSVRIQILSDLVKGMRALGKTPVALILGMPASPTESAIEEQARDIIHRMQQQKVSLRLAGAYNSEFPRSLWTFLCDKFLPKGVDSEQLVNSATIESLGQLCERSDLTSGPRTVVEIFKRIAQFAAENDRPYTPLDLMEDYLTGAIQLYGPQQHRINHALNNLESVIAFPKHPKAKETIKLLAGFPAGVTLNVAKKFKLSDSLKKLAADDLVYGQHIIQLTEKSFALIDLYKQNRPTVVDKIINQFRQRWFSNWNDTQKEEKAIKTFVSEIVPLLFPPARSAQKANWNWRFKDEWQQDRYGLFNFLTGAPEKYYAEFPNRSLVVGVGSKNSDLMKFRSPEETHLDFRFYLNYDSSSIESERQSLMAIAGTSQVDFNLQLNRCFGSQYPKNFGLLARFIPAEKCSICTLLALSEYIQEWLLNNPEVSKADRARLEHHRQECHQHSLRLLFPNVTAELWKVEGLEGLEGSEIKLVESVFYQKCKALFPEYRSYYVNLHPNLSKYKLALEKLPIAVRRGRQQYQAPKVEFQELFEATGSSLPSLLAIFKQHGLIDEYKIASKNSGKSSIKLAQNYLEEFISDRFELSVNNAKNTQNIKYEKLGEEVKYLGYLPEEFEAAIEWLELRRYIKWERHKGVISPASSELNQDDLKSESKEISSKVDSMVEVFNEKPIQEIKQKIGSINEFIECDPGSELELDKIRVQLQTYSESLEKFQNQKRSELQSRRKELQLKLANFTVELKNSKVSQIISTNSELEECLNKYRKQLEKEIDRLDKSCQKEAGLLSGDTTDILMLQEQIETGHCFLKKSEKTFDHLKSLVDGLEEWRLALTRAEGLRERLLNQPEHLQDYNDKFVDRAIVSFDKLGIESFLQHEELERPLDEIEEQIKNKTRGERAVFENRLDECDRILAEVAGSKNFLRERCKFDSEDLEGSIAALEQVLIEGLIAWCDRENVTLSELEEDFCFMSRKGDDDLTSTREKISNLKIELRQIKEQLPSTINDPDRLEEAIANLKSIGDKKQELEPKKKKNQLPKKDRLNKEEKKVLNLIAEDDFYQSPSKLYQNLSEDTELGKLLTSLYEKGYINILIRPRK